MPDDVDVFSGRMEEPGDADGKVKVGVGAEVEEADEADPWFPTSERGTVKWVTGSSGGRP